MTQWIRRAVIITVVAVAVAAVAGIAESAVPTPGVATARLGMSASVGTANLTRFSTIILSTNQSAYLRAIRAASTGTRVLGYKSATEIAEGCADVASCASGITYQQAVAHDAAHPSDPWLAKDASGKSITAPAYPHAHLANVGSKSYQQAWIKSVAGTLSRSHFNGVYIDTVLGTITGWSGGAVPTTYPTNAAWESAMRKFVATTGPALKKKGLYVLVNAFKAGSNDGSRVVAWWRSLAPYVSGLQSEYWEQSPVDVGTPFDTNPTVWTGHWLAWLKLAAVAQSANDDFYVVQKGTSNSTQMMTYGKASYLLVWNGKGGGYSWVSSDNGDPWNAAYTLDVGKPKGARYAVGVGWRREYSGGTVLVNPHYSKAQTFSLGGQYRNPDGDTVSAVTLQPHTAMILTRASGRNAAGHGSSG